MLWLEAETKRNSRDLAPSCLMNDTVIHAVTERENLSKSISHALLNSLCTFWEGSQKCFSFTIRTGRRQLQNTQILYTVYFSRPISQEAFTSFDKVIK